MKAVFQAGLVVKEERDFSRRASIRRLDLDYLRIHVREHFPGPIRWQPDSPLGISPLAMPAPAQIPLPVEFLVGTADSTSITNNFVGRERELAELERQK
jgi:hypothetical protein